MKTILILLTTLGFTACNAPTTKIETSTEASREAVKQANAIRSCCSAEKTTNCTTPDPKDPKSYCKMDTSNPMDSVTEKISQDELAQLYLANRKKLGPACSSPASAYCGKVTRDLRVTQDEFTCLWTKVFRTSRETLPRLDDSSCAKIIKKFAKK